MTRRVEVIGLLGRELCIAKLTAGRAKLQSVQKIRLEKVVPCGHHPDSQIF
jgi:hypothetical protein